jgi:hypothetical protein
MNVERRIKIRVKLRMKARMYDSVVVRCSKAALSLNCQLKLRPIAKSAYLLRRAS